jgi:hypothetical protein
MTVNEGEAFVANGEDVSETARELLEAAEKAGLDPSVVRAASSDGGFIVPEELAPKPKAAAKKTTTAKSKTDDEKK